MNLYYLDPLDEAKHGVERIHRFVKLDGMISHARLLRMNDSSHRNDQHIYWVRNGNTVIRFNVETKAMELVGETPNSILAFSVSTGFVREADRKFSHNQQSDLEADNIARNSIYIACVDESETVTIFTNKEQVLQEKAQLKAGDGVVNKKLKISTTQFNVKEAAGMSQELRDKDLFGMGYPYHICFYAEQLLAISSDYGVLVMNVRLSS